MVVAAQQTHTASGVAAIACQAFYRLGEHVSQKKSLTHTHPGSQQECSRGQNAEHQMSARQVTLTWFARASVGNNASAEIRRDGTQRLVSVRSTSESIVPI